MQGGSSTTGVIADASSLLESLGVPAAASTPSSSSSSTHDGSTTSTRLSAAQLAAAKSEGREWLAQVADPLDGLDLVRQVSSQPSALLTGHGAAASGCAMCERAEGGAHGHGSEARVLSCSTDGTSRLWDLHTGRTLCLYEEHTGPVVGCAVSDDGRLALTVGLDQTAQAWSVAQIAAASPGDLRRTWSSACAQGQLRRMLVEGVPRSVAGGCALSADGARALTCDSHGLARCVRNLCVCLFLLAPVDEYGLMSP
jgi:WD40 repeat protein